MSERSQAVETLIVVARMAAEQAPEDMRRTVFEQAVVSLHDLGVTPEEIEQATVVLSTEALL